MISPDLKDDTVVSGLVVRQVFVFMFHLALFLVESNLVKSPEISKRTKAKLVLINDKKWNINKK